MWKTSIKYLSILLSGAIVSKFFLFLYNALIIRELTVNEYAIFTLLMSIFNWTFVFSHFDLSSAVSKYVSESVVEGDFEKGWNLHANAVYICLALATAGVVGAMLISSSTRGEKSSLFVFYLSLIPAAVVTINNGLINGYGKFVFSALIDGSTGFSRFMFLFIFLLLIGNLNLEKSLILFAAASLIPFTLSTFGLLSVRPDKASHYAGLRLSRMQELVSYSKWVCATDMLSSGIFLFTSFTLALWSHEDLARFGVIVFFYGIFQLSFVLIPSVLIPQVSQKVAQGESIGLLGAKEFGIVTLGTLVAIALLQVSSYNQEIIQLMFHKSLYSDSLTYAAILLLTLPFKIFAVTYKGIAQGMNHPRAIASVSLWSSVVYAICLIPMYRGLGIMGVVVSLNIMHVVEFLLCLRAVRKILDSKYSEKNVYISA